MTIAKMLAIRRDLESGYHKFKQIGQTVYHTLDGVNWIKAFVLPNSEGAAASTNNTSITNSQLWRAIVIGDANGQKPEDIYPELKKVGKELALSGCWAVRAIVYGPFVKFYQEFVKEYIVNETAQLTEADIKGLFTEGLDLTEYLAGTPAQSLNESLVFLAETLVNLADEFAMFFDELFYQLVADIAFTLYNPDLSPKTLLFDELVCDIAQSISTDESYSNFKTVAGELPTIIYDAWENFASRDIWRVYLFLSRTAPKDITCPCGDECYSIPPSTMIINSTTSGQPYATRNGDWLEMNTLAWVAPWIPNAIRVTTFYPISDPAGASLKSITFFAKISGGLGSGGMVWRAFGIKMDNTEEVITGANKPLYNDEREYSFEFPENYPPPLKAVRLELNVSGALGTGSVTEAQHKAMRATLKSVIICLD